MVFENDRRFTAGRACLKVPRNGHCKVYDVWDGNIHLANNLRWANLQPMMTFTAIPRCGAGAARVVRPGKRTKATSLHWQFAKHEMRNTTAYTLSQLNYSLLECKLDVSLMKQHINATPPNKISRPYFMASSNSHVSFASKPACISCARQCIRS